MFSGSKTGSLASRMAYYLMKEITNNVDFAIDFHNGGEQRNNFPQIRYTSHEKGSASQYFHRPRMFGSKLFRNF